MTGDTRDLLVLAQEPWDDLWRRSQLLVRFMTEREPQLRVLYVEPPADLARAVARPGRGARGGLRQAFEGARAVPGLPAVRVLTPLAVAPDRMGAGRWLNAALVARRIGRALAATGMRRPPVWTQDPLAAGVIQRLDTGPVIYDVTDDWGEVESFSPGYRERVKAGDARMNELAAAIVVCSNHLLRQRAAGAARRVHLIPNGVDVDAYSGPPGAEPGTLSALRRPRLGYAGTLHEERLDIDLIGGVAAAMPEAAIVLFGPDHLSAGTRSRLAAANIHLMDPVPHGDIPAWLAAMDVCILPHRVTPFTDSLDPLKLLEYLAARRPVVATPVAAAREMDGVVRLAATAAEFAAQVRAAIAEPRPTDAAAALVARSSWSARAAEALVVVAEARARS